MSVFPFHPPATIAYAPFVAHGYASTAGFLVEAGIYTPGTRWTHPPLVAANIVDASRFWVAEFPTTPGTGTYQLVYTYYHAGAPYANAYFYPLTVTSITTASASTAIHPLPGTVMNLRPIPAANFVAYGTITAGVLLAQVKLVKSADGADVLPDIALVRGERWLARWKGLTPGALTLVHQAVDEAAAQSVPYLTVPAMFTEMAYEKCEERKP